MNGAAAFVQGLALSLATIAAFGPQNLHVLRTGLARRHVGAAVALCVAGDALLVGSALAGAAPALERVGWLEPLLAGAAAAMLLVFALRALGEAAAPQAALGAGAQQPLRRVLATTAVVTFGNPSVWVETLLLVGATGAALPGDLRPAFGAGALCASLLWFGALGFGARAAARWLVRPLAWRLLSLASAAAMGAMALSLAAQALA
ncbi:MAG: LysE family transporter [Piscinibacter sp.]|nr:LysE family transporter [Piscinibacter sp.]